MVYWCHLFTIFITGESLAFSYSFLLLCYVRVVTIVNCCVCFVIYCILIGTKGVQQSKNSITLSESLHFHNARDNKLILFLFTL